MVSFSSRWQRLEADELLDVLVFHIREQNAGLIMIRRATVMDYQLFEASPTNSDLLTTSGRLLRSLPEPVVEVPLQTAMDGTFIVQLAIYLATMIKTDFTVEPNDDALARRSEEDVVETADPSFMTEILTGILRGLGDKVDDVERFQKATRDDNVGRNTRTA